MKFPPARWSSSPWPIACLLFLAASSASCASGDVETGGDCSDHSDCKELDHNDAACSDDGLCIMDCSRDKPCLSGAICLTDTSLGSSWSYCTATCSNPSGEQEDCPSAKLKCYEFDGKSVCLQKPDSIL